MPLTKDTPREFHTGDFEEYPLAAGAIVYQGAAIGENGSGYARPLVAGDRFLGFADEPATNPGAAGVFRVKVRTRGRFQLSVASLAITDNDRVAVYASADDTFTKIATNNSYIGTVSRFISAGLGIIEFDASRAS